MQAPPFTVFSKKDAIWSSRVFEGNSLRQSRHLIDARRLRATEYHEGEKDPFDNKKLQTKEAENLEEAHPIDKVRMFLESQGFGIINESELEQKKTKTGKSSRVTTPAHTSRPGTSRNKTSLPVGLSGMSSGKFPSAVSSVINIGQFTSQR